MMYVAGPMRVNEIDLFLLNDIEYRNIQCVVELYLQCLESTANQLVRAEYPDCSLTLLAGNGVTSNKRLIRRTVLRVGGDKDVYVVTVRFVLGQRAATPQFD